MGRTHVWRSLKTTNKAEAVRRSRIVAADIETIFRTTDSDQGTQFASTAYEPKTERVAALIPIKQPKSLRDLFDLFTHDPAKHRVHRTSLALESVASLMFDLLGAETLIAIIDREMCRGLLETLRWLPTNSTKRFPKLSPTQAAQMAKDKRLDSVLSATSVNSYMNILRSAFNFAVNEGWNDRNPAKGLRVSDPVDRRDKRLPFSTHQLQLIFNAPLYRGCVNDEAGYANVGPNIMRRGRFWVPLIALYSGMRLNEICQLDTADVRTIDGIDCFVISQRSDSGADDKKIKTSMSERIVPIHTTILECGFAEFVSNRRMDGGLKLFPELPISTTGYSSDPSSKWFRRFVEKAEATRPKTCFHSFRHCFRDALREVRGLDHDVALALGGWASANGRETAESYGRGFRVATLHDALNQIEYQELDLSHLKTNVSPSKTG
jgi:integrase